jgi:hypothetical protein
MQYQSAGLLSCLFYCSPSGQKKHNKVLAGEGKIAIHNDKMAFYCDAF